MVIQMTEKRYYYDRALDKIKNRETGDDYWFLCDIADLLNGQDKTIKELKKENENQNNVLEDFMVMLNRLQAEPNNKSLQGMARDMLRMMGKDIMGDSE